MPRRLRPQARQALLNAINNGEDLSQGIVSAVVKKVAETDPPVKTVSEEARKFEAGSELEKYRANPNDQFELLRSLRSVIADPNLTEKFLELNVPTEVLVDVLGNDAERFLAGENSIGMDTRGIKMEELERLKDDQGKMLEYVRSVMPKRPE